MITLLDKQGNEIQEQDNIMERIEEFYSELYDSDQAVIIIIIIIIAGMAVVLRGWLPHRGEAQMAYNDCFPTRTMF